MEKIIFLDRDGVINKYPGDYKYVTSIGEFEFLPRAKEALALLSATGYKIFVISNQAGIAKGIYSLENLNKITAHLLRESAAVGGKIEKALYCIHAGEQHCECRKPKLGLIKEALSVVSADVTQSFFVGDSIRDVKTGKAAGCKTILVLSGMETLDKKEQWEVAPDYVVEDLFAAAQLVIKTDSNKL